MTPLGEVIARFRALDDDGGHLKTEATVSGTVGPFMGSINGQRAVDVRSEGGKRKAKKTALPLIRRSGPAGTGE